MPRFTSCSFASIVGRLGINDLPEGVFANCSFEDFPEAGDSNASILDAESLPRGTRVTMALLRKLYLQRGSGRKDNALTRGMSPKDAELVKPAMQLLQREGLAIATQLSTSLVWLPDRSAGPRVRTFLSSPRIGDDPLVRGVKDLS